jgi:uncharacterized protein (DUF2236 family)
MTAEVFPADNGLFEQGAVAFAASVPETPADDGFFGPASVTWRLHGDLTMPLAGLRSLLLQALHPLAMAGVDQHSDWRTDPAARFASTGAYLVTITYGDTATARAAANRVKRIHDRVRGTDPVTGLAYQAGDPDLLIWVHAGLVDSGLAAAELYGTAYSEADRDSYLAEMTVAAELLGVPPGRTPASVAELSAYFDAIRPQLTVTPAAAAAARDLLVAPEPAIAEIWDYLARAAVGSLPGWVRDMYGFTGPRWAPQDRASVRQLLGVLDAIYIGAPGVLEARQRLAVRMRNAR